jgi:lipopolysaccharide/colanic/teichoic acid biosynthesis glycosyltransferase
MMLLRMPFGMDAVRPPLLDWTSPDVARRTHLQLKRCLDVAVAAVLLVALLPVLVAIGIGVKVTSPGPVWFAQWRLGKGGVPFRIWKFRTMFEEACDGSGLAQVRQGDARVTRLGRWLRRWSLDELPQLINVLWGDMSLVGPRPHVARQLAAGQSYETLVPQYAGRLAMRPGLTGLAQAQGLRGPTLCPLLARQRIERDLAYIEGFSIWLDLSILAMTLWRELPRGGGE